MLMISRLGRSWKRRRLRTSPTPRTRLSNTGRWCSTTPFRTKIARQPRRRAFSPLWRQLSDFRRRKCSRESSRESRLVRSPCSIPPPRRLAWRPTRSKIRQSLGKISASCRFVSVGTKPAKLSANVRSRRINLNSSRRRSKCKSLDDRALCSR